MNQDNENSGPGPLSGYRVLDFGWVLAGALPGMVLADMGAEVLKVETRQRMDYMRLGRPIIGDEPDPEQHPLFHNVNRGKLSIAVNTTKPGAIDLIKELVPHCDVVVENFSPGVMDRLGLGYDVLSGIKSEIVMASISSNGQTGPLRDLRAYAPSIGALSGLDSTMGYEGERPLGLKHAYADIVGALHSVFAIVSALHQKERTGQGQYIDVSMLRATVATMGAGLMEYEMTGRVMGPKGNYDPAMAPYGNYPCQGDDAWVSIAVRTEDEWQGLKTGMDNPAWCEEERFSSRYSRLENRRDLDDNLSAWTRERTPGYITELLQANGVAAIPVMGAEDRLFNPHFKERGLYSDIEHPSLGAEPVYNIMWNLERTPPSIHRHAPLLGEHNQKIFGGLLGMAEEEITRLEEDQVLW
ncbi:MAG: CoA transferase [SAR202 cluster bacterium]|nr:CoA transferase [SAR202 cluster bacterium]